MSDSASTGPTIPSGMSIFLAFAMRFHFEGTMVEIKVGGSGRVKGKGERQLGRLLGNLCCS